MQDSGVPVTPEPESDRRVDCPAGDLGKQVPIVAIHQGDSDHRSQNYKEKPQT
jgi:hypothetical protein